jgi:hypothetical protein
MVRDPDLGFAAVVGALAVLVEEVGVREHVLVPDRDQGQVGV